MANDLARDAAEIAERAEQRPVTEEEGSPTPEPRWKPDRDGRTEFDPRIHQSKDGKTPHLSKGGRLQLKSGRGSPRFQDRQASQPRSIPPGQAPGKAGPAPSGPSTLEIAAFVVDNELALLQMTLGPGWAPLPEERQSLVESWGLFLDEQGITNVPPWLGLAIVHLAFAMRPTPIDDSRITTVGAQPDKSLPPRILSVGTRRRFRELFGSIRPRGFFRRLVQRIRGRRNAHTDHRASGEREEHARETSDGRVPENGIRNDPL